MGVSTVSVDWVDPGTGLKARIPVADGADVHFAGASDDLKYILVVKSGPKQPPEFYLLTDGAKLALLGKSRPWIDPAALGDTRLVEYAARDGLMIPAFLTTPPKDVFGPGPYPTLIEPHGGPWARDDMDWDVSGWIQYFAARGFALLQPQFRGSEGWGQKLWRAGDGEWGQKMQGDNDDGVKWPIDQHIADPARVAMFGYSYGGYAALAASIRPNGLYQCTIFGAGAGDLAEIEQATFDNRFQREFQHPTIAGLDALAHAKEAKIPVMLYHGDRDQTVDVEQSRKFAAALKAAGKPYRYVEIKDMGHQYIFMTPPCCRSS
ncbi:MAG: alpha/beta hydrolase family protein [Caulobacterales bacterium]